MGESNAERTIIQYDKEAYRLFTSKSEVDKAFHLLEGILKGIAIDNEINDKEIAELSSWCDSYSCYVSRQPFDEVIDLVSDAIQDRILDESEKEDILWFCNKMRTQNTYFDVITSDLQRLEGILHGILADNIITDNEINNLKTWINHNKQLIGKYPYDEISSLLTTILEDGIIDESERKMLKLFFSDFVDKRFSSNLNEEELNSLRQEMTIHGICVLNPSLILEDKLFCFTGKSSRTNRKEISNIITSCGGKFNNNVVKNTNYLIIGNEGNPCWAFSCYGRKVEKAVQMRKDGQQIQIVHENDFWEQVNSI